MVRPALRDGVLIRFSQKRFHRLVPACHAAWRRESPVSVRHDFEEQSVLCFSCQVDCRPYGIRHDDRIRKIRWLRSNTYRSRVTNSTGSSDFANFSSYSSTNSGGLCVAHRSARPCRKRDAPVLRVNRRLQCEYVHMSAATIVRHRLRRSDDSTAKRAVCWVAGYVRPDVICTNGLVDTPVEPGL